MYLFFFKSLFGLQRGTFLLCWVSKLSNYIVCRITIINTVTLGKFLTAYLFSIDSLSKGQHIA